MARRMTTEQWIEMFEQADSLENLTPNSCRRILRCIKGEAKSANVWDMADDTKVDPPSVFTLAALSKAWTHLAREQGMSGIDYYESGEPDSLTYSAAFEIAIFGEVIYG